MPGFPKIYDDLGGFWMLEEKLRNQWRKTIYPVLEVNDHPITDHSR
ncbi:hypothetical protein SAMN05444008_101364 [Cnuella takakiae]|uniref:Uncharacterized protein n=1 Tax=Cnuella takakiae TaxID=1302690 RepID=A0A1M4TA92_9BACT|nr:hypothetical protein [Cnuella takakiae]SHE41381.1 hypothetical protein SAMN05444008_101364 [Cnuella takakiae]